MSSVYPWIGFKRKEDRERFKQRIFSEYKKTKPSACDLNSPTYSRAMTDKEIIQYLNIHNAKYGEGQTFYIISDLIKMPEGLHWLIFCGYWELVDTLEKILKKEYKDYVFLVAN